MKIRTTIDAVRSWSLRKRLTVGFAVSLIAGFVRIEFLEFGTGDVWKTGPVSLLIYAFFGAGSILFVGILAAGGLLTLGVAAYFGLYAVMISVGVLLALVAWVLSFPRRIMALPEQIGRWVTRHDRRDFVGFGLVGGFVTLASGAWFWLGGFTAEGVTFWFKAAIAVLVLWLTAGFVVGFAAFLLVDSLPLGRVGNPRWRSRVEELAVGFGFLAGSAIVWFLGAGESIGRDANFAGITWASSWVIWVVSYSYTAVCVGSWRAIQRFRENPSATLSDRGDSTADLSHPVVRSDRDANVRLGTDETGGTALLGAAGGQLQLWGGVDSVQSPDGEPGASTELDAD